MAVLSSSRRKRQNGGSPSERARKKFLRFYPEGFRDPSYIELQRGHKYKD